MNLGCNFERQCPNSESNKIFVFHFHKGNSKIISYTGPWHKEKHFHSSALAGRYPAWSSPFFRVLFSRTMLDFYALVFQHPNSTHPFTTAEKKINNYQFLEVRVYKRIRRQENRIVVVVVGRQNNKIKGDEAKNYFLNFTE